eukprot:NODE_109_length_18665_cov_0.924486.p2 type:complete len:481 gc:universal NODE_109_length_18665_cov_0.924486:15440-13998(-)
MLKETRFGNLTTYEKMNTNKVCLVFIHGLGGQSEQFKPIYNYFSSTYHVISIDLFGHGQSGASQSYDLQDMAQQYCDLLPEDKMFVIIAHSMGCGIAVYMNNILKESVKGFVFIGSQYTINLERVKGLVKLPLWVVELWRWYYRFGGIYGQSVKQYIFYPAASKQVKMDQARWNKQSRTETLFGIFNQIVWPDDDLFRKIIVPVQLIVGEYDQSTPIKCTLEVFNFLNGYDQLEYKRVLTRKLTIAPNAIHPYPIVGLSCGHNVMSEDPFSTIGYITHFFQHLKILCHPPSQSKEFKMDDPYALKNFKKWKVIQPVSGLIGNSKFRAMKILREIDDEHNPKLLIENYENVGLVIDMSRDVPPYNVAQFQSIHPKLIKYNRSNTPYECKGDSLKPMYIKQSFVSKIPPSEDDVEHFVNLCKDYWEIYPNREISLHCHYGFNRTGFMIVAAMFKLGFVNHIMEGLQAFKLARSPGVKYFVFI